MGLSVFLQAPLVQVFVLLFTLPQPPKCLWTTGFSLSLGKQPRWPSAQLIQSWHKGFKDRPADRLSKAWAENALAPGHRDTQVTAQVVPMALGRMSKCVSPHLCPCLYTSLYGIKKNPSICHRIMTLLAVCLGQDAVVISLFFLKADIFQHLQPRHGANKWLSVHSEGEDSSFLL